MHRLFAAQAARTPDAPAILSPPAPTPAAAKAGTAAALMRELALGPAKYTYRELAEAVDLLARSLQSQGVAEGSVCGLYMPHMAEYIVANLAILQAGGAILLLEATFTAEMIETLVADMQVRGLCILYMCIYTLI